MVTLDLILAELDRATAKFPTWPTDPLHALAVLGEEYGELNKAMLQLVYEPHKTDAQQVRLEAIQTAAMALRLAMSLGDYEYAPSAQHKQKPRQHSDDVAVDRFAVAMKKKMAAKRAVGYGGWDDFNDCPTRHLQAQLTAHVVKGDPVDVGNFAMMLFNRGESTRMGGE